MNKITDRFLMIRILLREYYTYITNDPSLILKIPQRSWEEASLHIGYSFAKFTELITGKRNNNSLIHNLHVLTSDMEKADDVYKPSLLWKDLYEQFERTLYVSNIEHFKTQRYNRRFSCFYPNTIIIFQMFMWLYWNNIKSRDTLHLLKTIEEPTLGRGETYEIGGKKMSHDLLQSLDEFYAIYPYLKKKDDLLICELGAGYGRLAYVFLKAIPNSTYVVVDLPGSLIISQYYLSSLFSKKDVLTYEESKKLKKLDRKTLRKYKVVCLAPWQLPLFEDKSLDIFINIYSFQEMTMKQIRNYFSLINTKCKGFFYSKQYFISDNPKDDVHIELKDYPVNKKWKTMYEKPSTIHQPNFEALYKIL